MCGEKRIPKGTVSLVAGSPPHVRGKEYLSHEAVIKKGITPACAGKRLVFLSAAREKRDHPRMCGEKGGNVCNLVAHGGSPPHVRGKVPSKSIAMA